MLVVVWKQCKNAHMACQACCKTRTRGQCPKCFQPIGRTRNKAVEEMLASLISPCKHAVHGCKRMLTSTNRKQHELYECEFMLLNCPFQDCRFSSSIQKYSAHVEQKHKDARVIRHNESAQLLTFGGFNLDSRDECVLLKACPELFLLHQEDTALGQMLYVTSCGKDKRYSLEVILASESYEKEPKTFKVETMTSNGKSLRLRDFLLVPKQNISSHRLPVSARCTVIIPQDYHL
jgi:hypothetical protein